MKERWKIVIQVTLLTELRHENIVKMKEVALGRDVKSIFLVMEFCEQVRFLIFLKNLLRDGIVTDSSSFNLSIRETQINPAREARHRESRNR